MSDFNLTLIEHPDFSRIERIRRIADLNVESSEILGAFAIQSDIEEGRGYQDTIIALQQELAAVSSEPDKKNLIIKRAEDTAQEFHFVLAQWRSGFLDAVSHKAHLAGFIDGNQVDSALTKSARHNSVDYMRGVYNALVGLVSILNAVEDPTTKKRTGIFFREKRVVFRVGPLSFSRYSKLPGHFIGDSAEMFRDGARAKGLTMKIEEIMLGTIEEIVQAYNRRLKVSLAKD